MFSAEDYLQRPPDNTKPRSVIACAAAVLGTVACFAATRVLDHNLQVNGRGTGPTDVPFGAVVLATLVAWCVAVGIAALARRASRPRAMFVSVTAVGAALATVPPLVEATDRGSAVWLLGMHAIVAAAIVPVLAGSLPTRRREELPTTGAMASAG